ncbi:hypothetical protein AC578_6824 [Pseudocercospora eumusae]|uniref:SAP domain-containing protein n=1 Tax=Pseudocercospora eumusae TaxID=321146 RepID=A0A139H4W1_9PEZI|nr:hypothetical protein AC578_6824 [Pseudocercospora eumusae]
MRQRGGRHIRKKRNPVPPNNNTPIRLYPGIVSFPTLHFSRKCNNKMQQLQQQASEKTSNVSDRYEKWLLSSLRAEATARGLPIKGRKRSVIARLEASDQAQAQAQVEVAESQETFFSMQFLRTLAVRSTTSTAAIPPPPAVHLARAKVFAIGGVVVACVIFVIAVLMPSSSGMANVGGRTKVFSADDEVTASSTSTSRFIVPSAVCWSSPDDREMVWCRKGDGSAST